MEVGYNVDAQLVNQQVQVYFLPETPNFVTISIKVSQWLISIWWDRTLWTLWEGTANSKQVCMNILVCLKYVLSMEIRQGR